MSAPTASHNRGPRPERTAWPFGLLFPAVSVMGPKRAFPHAGTGRLSTIGARKPKNGLDCSSPGSHECTPNQGGEEVRDADRTDIRELQVETDATR